MVEWSAPSNAFLIKTESYRSECTDEVIDAKEWPRGSAFRKGWAGIQFPCGIGRLARAPFCLASDESD